jgi:VanZ family protein
LKRRLRWALAGHLILILLVGGLAYLGQLPFTVQSLHPSADKAMHFLLIGGLAFWLVGVWDDARLRIAGLGLPLAILVPGLLSGLEEGLQLLSSRRSADPLDFAADMLGLVVFWALGRSLLLAPPKNDELAA